jgi:hypothetical protein
MITLSRRRLFAGALASLATPTIIRHAGLLMPVRPVHRLLTINEITREAIRLWKNNNAFLRDVDTQYTDEFVHRLHTTGTVLRVRLPNEFVVA